MDTLILIGMVVGVVGMFLPALAVLIDVLHDMRKGT